MTQSFNNATGDLFGLDRAGQVLDLNQAVVDRLETVLGARPDRPEYGSWLRRRGQVTYDTLRQSIESSLEQDDRVESVHFEVVDRDLLVLVNRATDAPVTTVGGVRAIDSPLYIALNTGLTGDQSFNLRDLLSWDNAPIEVIRGFTETIGLVPHTQLLGERFERAVARAWWQFFTIRDQEAFIRLFTQLAGMSYELRVNHPNTGELWICFTPSPDRAEGLDTLLTEKLQEILDWGLPFWDGRITILECRNALATVYFNQFISSPVTVFSTPVS